MLNKKKNRILVISSWKIVDDEGKILIPFIFEQIEVLSKKSDIIFVEPVIISIQHWIYLFLKGEWIKKTKLPWHHEKLRNSSFKLFLPRVSNRITKNTLERDFFWSVGFLSKNILKRIGQIDFIHLHTVLPLGTFVLGLFRKRKIPFILQEHSAPFEMHLNTSEKVEWVEEILISASKIVAVGPGLAKRLKELVPVIENKVIVIPEMIRTDVFDLTENALTNSINLISIGGLVKRKGYDILIEAIVLLRNEGLNVKLWIVGGGSELSNLQSMITQFSLENYVFLPGHLSKEEINNLLNSMNIYVHSSYRETFGIAPTEAMLKGRPVVSTICEGPEFYITDENGVLVEVGNVSKLADGIRYVIKNFSSYDPIRIRKSVSEKFGKTAFLNQMLLVYSEINE